jgi:glycosyltransferase involved in cell wall biosynthesis
MNSIVIPVYRNEDSIPALVSALATLNERIEGGIEAVFVVDGSPDRSAERLAQELRQSPFRADVYQLSRNYGAFAAVRMGLSAAKGRYFAVMAADLQEPPELLVEFFQSLRTEPVDVVIGQRTDRDDPATSKLASGLFWSVFRRLVMPAMPPGGVDIFGCNSAVRDALLELNESNSSLIGLVFWLGFRRKCIPYARRARHDGKGSSWSFSRKVRYMVDSIFSFTDLPISVMLFVGTIGILMSAIASLVVLLSWSAGKIPVLGYTPIILSIWMSTSLILFSLGILGSYLWRAFENTKQRPHFVPMLHHSYPEESPR